MGVTSGKHWFSVCITQSRDGFAIVGWADAQLRVDVDDENGPGNAEDSSASGATFTPHGYLSFGTAPLSANQFTRVPYVPCPCTV